MSNQDKNELPPLPIRLGLCLAAYGGLTLENALSLAAEHGPLFYDLPTDTNLGLVDGRRCYEDKDYRADIATRLKEKLHPGSQLACISNSRDAQLLLGPHGIQTDPVLRAPPDEKRNHARKCAMGTIRLAETLGVTMARLQPGCPDFSRWLSWSTSPASWQDNVDEFFKHSEALLQSARDSGITILLEPHPKQVIYDRASADLLFRSGKHWKDTLALCLDPANLGATGHDAERCVPGWSGRVLAAHAKDLEFCDEMDPPQGAGWTRYGPQRPFRFRALGLGGLNWEKIVSSLLDTGFSGILYVEHEDALMPRQQSIARSLKRLRSCIPAAAPEGRTW